MRFAIDTVWGHDYSYPSGLFEGPADFNNWIADERERLGTRQGK